MSRSYKKNPIYTDRPDGAKYWKRLANKKVRRKNNHFLKGNKYKRIFNSWEIHDYISRWSKYQALNDFKRYEYLKEEYKNEEDFLNKHWKKYQYRK